ncbi:hypothetical protein M2U48_002731 [Salmonella enterica]|nr:hypothetical protein [Salmonella enterica]EBJ0302852.1 hypothetical protein [Salmonella enterica]EDN2069488.1 hypothetical protein [Salmonella enterica]EFV1354702.1 hypothetical protein [Salmonella enterica]EHS6132459.1 hypothetical protein [Salmonella enterica]
MTQSTALALTADMTPPPVSEDSPAQSYRATYSPDDNKLRLYAAHPRLLIVSITGLPVGNILSLSFCMALFSVPVPFHSAADIY